MVRKTMIASEWFWNQLGFAIAVLSLGVSWNISRTKILELQIAEYKLKTGTALSKVQKVKDELKQSAQTLPIAAPKRQEIVEQLEESSAILDEAEKQIERDEEKLINSEKEE